MPAATAQTAGAKEGDGRLFDDWLRKALGLDYVLGYMNLRFMNQIRMNYS